jgi:hypothetical protein
MEVRDLSLLLVLPATKILLGVQNVTVLVPDAF